jgi:hypothetical protein
MKTEVQFMIRVKLPEPNPRTEDGYDADYSAAINAVKPYGFEVKWPNEGDCAWPVDSEGFTFVPLYVSTTEAGMVNTWISRYYALEDRHRAIKDKAKELASMA